MTLWLLAKTKTQMDAVHMSQWLAACWYRRCKLSGGVESLARIVCLGGLGGVRTYPQSSSDLRYAGSGYMGKELDHESAKVLCWVSGRASAPVHQWHRANGTR
jgi:hypothetical protein